jgi:Tol biopolymer transport system component/tRNA A-37 threonylcarbamoyl transferase component Bud32
MPAAGDKLGPYEILSFIGKGGMGEVFRARDTRLNRDVAIKASIEQFSGRFEREARAIAALNHPTICHIYDVGPNYLVMELVEGPTLAERLSQGPIPLEESLNIARQIADALDAAHEKGITHRDLKPGNIKIKPDGTVKVLDFGLAKMGGTPMMKSDESPTITMAQTEAGLIVGTAAYMAPEQAKGKAVDHRADIYAFGVVLYEMVTGKRLHDGETTTEVLASVIKEDPSWRKVPPQLHRLLRRCLEKDPQKRLRHIGDVMALVDEGGPAVQTASPVRREGTRKWLWAGTGVVVLALATILALWAPWQSPSTAPSVRFEIQPTAAMTFINGGYPMVSPNGKWVVLPATGSDGVTRMWLRALDSVEARPLAGTESPNNLPPPVFWSPDSRFIAFSATPGPFAAGQLRKLDISGGPPQTLCDVFGAVSGGTWNSDGVILFATNGAPGLLRVSAAGGVATPLTILDRSYAETFHRYPYFLPDNHHFLYLRVGNDQKRMGIYVGSIDVKPEEQSLKLVLQSDRQAMYTASQSGKSGRLLFLRDTTLFTQPFDPSHLELSGEPVPVTDQVGSFSPATAGLFSVSEAGVLAYRVGPGGNQTVLTWFDRDGKPLGTIGEKGSYSRPVISPDGTHIAVTAFDRENGNSNIWVMDIASGRNTKITFNAGRNDFPVWSPDGTSIAFASNRNGHMDIYEKNADGSGEETSLLSSDEDKQPTSWSHDKRFLLYSSNGVETSDDVWVLPLEGDKRPFQILATKFREGVAKFSPDGHWIAYTSDESGTPEIYVRPFSPEKSADAASGGKWVISKGGGILPRWRADGKELTYINPALQQMAVDVSAGGTAFGPGSPRRLFNVPLFSPGDVTGDGKRFIYPTPEGSNAPSPFIVVTNWQSGLKK